MDVIIDGSQDFKLEGETENLLSLLGAVTEYLHEQRRALVSISIDGKDALPEDFAEKFDDRPLSSINEVSITSRTISELVESALKDLQDSLSELPEACRGLAAIFHGDQPEEGFDPFVELAGIWGHVKQHQSMAVNALGLQLEDVRIGEKSLAELHTELNAHLEECAGALKNGDCILIGDLLEYELAPRAEQEAEIVAALRDRNAAQTG